MAPDDDETQPGWAAPPPNPGSSAPPPEPPPAAPPVWGDAPPTSPIGIGSAPPSMGPAQPRQPGTRARRRWIWVLVASVVGVIALYAVDSVLFTQKIKPPIDATNAFVHDLRYHDYASAHRRLCATDRRNVSEQALATSLGGDFILGTFTGYSVNPFGVRFNGDRASVDFNINYGNQRNRAQTLHLVKQHGTWRPCGFS